MTSVCNCIIEFCSDETGELWSTIAEAIVSIALCVVGIILNLKILKKLKIEKRNKPLERKGNVVEPIMRWFCRIQIVAWPLHLLFYWTWKNGLIPSDILFGVCRPLALLVTSGRAITAYNSLFIALIRYIYIVHDTKANQWQFETVGSIFQAGSIITPITINTIAFLGIEPTFLDDDIQKRMCPHALNATEQENDQDRYTSHAFLMQFLPTTIVHPIGITFVVIHLMVYANLTEAYLYTKMFLKMKRQHDENFAKGILSEEVHDYYGCRRMISLKICFVGWLLELVGTAMTLLTPTLRKLGLSNLYYPDAIIMFVLIPLIHILNDDKTKGKIAENGWFAGLRFILGITNLQNQVHPQEED